MIDEEKALKNVHKKCEVAIWSYNLQDWKQGTGFRSQIEMIQSFRGY